MSSLSANSFIRRGKNLLHGLFPILAAVRFGIPGRRMTIIAITGTDGKSSSVILTAAMLRAAGYKTAHLSSISFHDGISEYPNDMKMTTPGRMRLHAFLAAARRRGCTHAVVEVTSEAVLQHRHRLIGFSLVGITNITPEHIEAHQGFERYQRAKISLVRALLPRNKGVVLDQGTYDAVRHLLPSGLEVAVAGIDTGADGRLTAAVVSETPFSTELSLTKGAEEVLIRTALGGPFASRNILFAAIVANLFGVPLTQIRDTVAQLGCIPGRFEVISNRPLVIADYAHTLNALSVLLPYVRARTPGTLVHVFGAAGGGRDRYKRPLIAKLSERYADISVVTEENSFDEPIQDILDEIRAGFSEAQPVYVLPRREDAVEFARTLLTSPDDTLLLTGKGSETVIMGAKKERRPYNERTYVRCLFETS